MNSLFDQAFSVETIFRTWWEFKRDKRKRREIYQFERHLENRLFALHDQLHEGSYLHGPYRPFTVFDPKERSISRASLKDRFVHHLVYKALVPVFCPGFIFHSLSCQEGKGTHLGVKQLGRWIAQVSANEAKPCFSLKMDIRRFFDSIDHTLLKKLIRRQVFDQKLLRLIDQIIDGFYLRVYLPWENRSTSWQCYLPALRQYLLA